MQRGDCKSAYLLGLTVRTGFVRLIFSGVSLCAIDLMRLRLVSMCTWISSSMHAYMLNDIFSQTDSGLRLAFLFRVLVWFISADPMCRAVRLRRVIRRW